MAWQKVRQFQNVCLDLAPEGTHNARRVREGIRVGCTQTQPEPEPKPEPAEPAADGVVAESFNWATLQVLMLLCTNQMIYCAFGQ